MLVTSKNISVNKLLSRVVVLLVASAILAILGTSEALAELALLPGSNVTNSAKTKVLPGDIATIKAQIAATKVQYPDRFRDMRAFEDYLANGDLAMAAYRGQAVLRKQANLRQRGSNGALPEDLKYLQLEVAATRVDYPGRIRDVQDIEDCLANGEFMMAEHKLQRVLSRQKNLTRAKSGPPPELQVLLDAISAEAIAYMDRQTDIDQMAAALAVGEFAQAEFYAQEILRVQRGLRDLENGLPQPLAHKLARIHEAPLSYADRPRDLRSLYRYLRRADLVLAARKMEDILTKQENLRQAAHGLPEPLNTYLLDLEKGAQSYPDRRSDVETLHRYLANGDFAMATYKAQAIIEQQRNVVDLAH